VKKSGAIIKNESFFRPKAMIYTLWKRKQHWEFF